MTEMTAATKEEIVRQLQGADRTFVEVGAEVTGWAPWRWCWRHLRRKVEVAVNDRSSPWVVCPVCGK